MNWADRLFVSVFLGSFLVLCYLMFFDHQKKTHNYHRIHAKLMDIQDIADDLKNFSKVLVMKNATANIQFDNNPDIYLMEKTFKMALIADVIEVKSQMMQEAVSDAMKELQPKPKFCETL